MNSLFKSIVLGAFMVPLFAISQTEIGVQVRPRGEFLNGFGQPIAEGLTPGAFVGQRSRLTINSSIEDVQVFFQLQNIRTWGAVNQLNANDNFNAMHQGFLQYKMDSLWTLKVGRQELAYDDERFFGAVDWANQARSHDLLVFQYKTDSMQLHFGGGYNAAGMNRIEQPYLLNNYRDIQFVHFNKTFEKLNWSVLGVNLSYMGNTSDGLPNYQQTFGTFLKSSHRKALNYVMSGYYQTGIASNDQALSAFQGALELNYKIKKTKVLAGTEWLSGTDMNASGNTSNSFNPLFGTNHKFNGLMDYFFVGNHGYNVGLHDIYFGAIQPISKKTKIIGKFHHFNSAATITDGTDEISRILGQEIDLVVVWKMRNNLNLKSGYSQFFTTRSLETVKEVSSPQSFQGWAWIMLDGKISTLIPAK